MRAVASVVLLLGACGPVLLSGDEPPVDHAQPGAGGSAEATAGARASDSGALAVAQPGQPQAAAPHASITVKSVDCGRCFELTASATDGTPPYRYEWEDGSTDAQRRVCGERDVRLIAQDAVAARSQPYETQLETDADAPCSTPTQPTSSTLCLMNPSFDGTPAVNLGAPGSFDAPSWNTCVSAADAATNPMPNTPEIANQDMVQTMPTDGATLLGLLGGEQVSQTLCAPLKAGTKLSVQLDLGQLAANRTTTPQTLEIWGGSSADCSQHQKLWTSPELQVGLVRYCAELLPTEDMDQLTLRAPLDPMGLPSGYELADNLVPVDRCP